MEKLRVAHVVVALLGGGSACCAAAAGQPSVVTSIPITAAAGERTGAGLATIDVTGIPSMDGRGSPNNTVLFMWVGGGNYVNGIGWDVVLQTIAPNSRRRDMSLLLTDTLNLPFTGWGIQPGAADPTPGGPTGYASDGILKVADYGIPPLRAAGDGYIRLEFHESPDHAPGQVDGLWVSGTVSFQTLYPIPPIVSPAAGASFALVGLMLNARRRSR